MTQMKTLDRSAPPTETTFEYEAGESMRSRLWERLAVVFGTIFLALAVSAGIAQAGPIDHGGTDDYSTPHELDRAYLLDPNSPNYDPDLWDELYDQAKGGDNEYKPRANLDDISAPFPGPLVVPVMDARVVAVEPLLVPISGNPFTIECPTCGREYNNTPQGLDQLEWHERIVHPDEYGMTVNPDGPTSHVP